jgi:hypothetical protein
MIRSINQICKFIPILAHIRYVLGMRQPLKPVVSSKWALGPACIGDLEMHQATIDPHHRLAEEQDRIGRLIMPLWPHVYMN